MHKTKNACLGSSFLFRTSAFMLIFLFFITPIAQVYADDDPSTPPQDTGGSEDPGDPPQNPTIQVPTIYPQQTAPTQKILRPDVDQTTGALTYHYAIRTPDGIKGQNPSLELIYNSQNNRNDSTFGQGWSINIPYIERENKHGTDQLYTGIYNDFSSSLFGELVQKNSTTYVPKSASDIVNLNFQNNIWTYTDKAGTVYTFGATSASRQDDPSNSDHISKWMLSSVVDSNSNAILYSYTKDLGQIYPNKVSYSIYEINFNLKTRLDPVESYSQGFFTKTGSIIDNITVNKNTGSTILLKRYSTSISTGNNGTKSLLSSITESAYDTNNVLTTLPPTTFTYNNSTLDIYNNGYSSYNIPNFFPEDVSNGSIVGSINDDAYPDVLMAYEHTLVPYYSNKKTFIYNPQTGIFDQNQNFTPPSGIMNLTDTSINLIDGGTRMIDVNGDLKGDMIKTPVWGGPGGWPADVELNNGINWTHQSNGSSTYYPAYSSNFPTYTGDFNGDGFPDYIEDIQYNGTLLSENNGSSYTTSNTSFTGSHPFNLYENGYLMFDINSDGLDDIIYAIDNMPCNSPSTYTHHVYINNGKDWILDDSYALPSDFAYYHNWCYSSSFTPPALADFNGDGLNDILLPNGTYLYLNQGKSFTAKTFSSTVFSIMNYQYSHLNNYQNPYFIMDINADGTPDYIWGNSIFFNTTFVPNDLLSSITSPTGGTTTVTYQSSAQYKDNNGNLLSPHLPFIIQTVKSTTTTDSVTGVTGTTNYTYSGGSYFYNGAFDRKFAGFNTVTKIDPAGNKIITYYHQGNDSDTTHGEYADDGYKIGKVYRTEQYDGNGNLYKTEITKWVDTSINSDSKFVFPARILTQTFDGGIPHKDTAVEYTYDNYGNILTKTNWGEVNGNNDGSFTDTGSDKSTENISYAYTSGNPVTGLPSQDTLLDQSSNKVNESKFYYDGLAFGQVDKGNQTKVEQWISGTTYVNSQKTYNSYGLVSTSTDPRGKVTSYTYDQYHLYPTTVTDPMNQTMSYVYDYSVGKPTQITDKNGFIYQTIYDGFGRVITEKIPSINTPTTLVTKTAYLYTDTQNAVSIKKTDYLDSTNQVYTYQYFDGLNRLIQERKTSESLGVFNVKDVKYNNLGLIQSESLKYAGNGYAKTSPTTNSDLYTNYSYDPVQRILSSTNSVGTTSYGYNNWVTTTTDPNGHAKKFYNDAYDNLVRVDEINGISVYSTYYTWNLNKKLTNITDALGNTRAFTYDGLGRRLTAEDLHSPSDTSFGSWSYAYDNAGNISQTINPMSYVVNYTYDNINRVLSEDWTGSTGTDITYGYDTCTNGVGKLCSVHVLGSVDASYTYDSNGNIVHEEKDINELVFNTVYTHDRLGNQINIKYPDNAEVRYTYNQGGLIDKVEEKQYGGNFADIVSNVDYNPMDQITTMVSANGVTTTNTYNANRLYRLTNKLTQKTSGPKIQDISYTYDNLGNITQIVDASDTNTARTVNYVYDDLNRLVSATATNVPTGQTPYTQTFTYNAIGNILTGPVGAYLYEGNQGTSNANPHAPTSINGALYAYDASGNLSSINSIAMKNVWNYRNELTKVTKVNNYSPDNSEGGDDISGEGEVPFYNDTVEFYFYDHDGNRVWKQNGNNNTYYPNKFYNLSPNGKVTKNIYVGDILVSTVETIGTTATPRYYHLDHLNSTNVVTDPSGDMVELIDYLPYGNPRITTGSYTPQRKYIGQYFDTETNLNYLNARYYEGSKGRFISQDPVFWELGISQAGQQALSDPQSMNSYSYAGNNPIKNSDPDGRWYKEFVWDNIRTGGNGQSWNSFSGEVGQATQYLGGGWQTAMDHPVAAGAAVGVASGAAALGISYLSGAGLVMDNLATGQMISTEGIQAIGARNTILNNSTNPKVVETINQMFKKGSDKIGGGTVEALKREVTTGQLTGDKSHIIKGEQFVNRISNLQKSQQLNQVEQKGLQSLSNLLQKLTNSAKK